MNTATNNAIAALNELNQKNVEAQAMVLIGRIQNEQAAIKVCEGQVAGFRTELDKLRQDVVDQTTVLGAPMTGTPNANEVTIAKAIARLNDEKQGAVNNTAISLTNCITAKQAAIKASQDRIAQLRIDLGKLSAEIITETAVVG